MILAYSVCASLECLVRSSITTFSLETLSIPIKYNSQHSKTHQKDGPAFNSRSGRVYTMLHLCCYELKRTNLKLKTCPKELLSLLPLETELPEGQ
jgi:hypothetical protein